MRNSNVDQDAGALALGRDALRAARRNIDMAIADHDLAAVTHWTAVWFKVQEIAFGQPTVTRDAPSEFTRRVLRSTYERA